MEVHVIAVVGSDLSIGRRGDLIRHLKEDLKHFKQLTLGHMVIMGRKTWESLPFKPLPGRRNIVVTRRSDFADSGCEVAGSLSEAFDMADSANPSSGGEGANAEVRKVFVIGGGEVYRQAVPLADVLDLTLVDAPCVDADTFFPDFFALGWKETPGSISFPATPSNPPFRFATFLPGKAR